MTGRDGGADLAPLPGESPIVVLVRPQLADNIGMVARAMANGGLFHLRLVAPRDGWPQERAWYASSGADRILDAATVHPTVADAVADCHRVFATCPRRAPYARARSRGAAEELVKICRGAEHRVAILFGPERAGLEAEDMAHADTLVRYPLNPKHMSLNLAQAVMIMAYEWWNAAEDQTPPRQFMTNETSVATRGELDNFLDRLVRELDASGFLDNHPKRAGMVRNLRHWFNRGEVTTQELRTLHGVVSELSKGRMLRGRPPEEDPPLPWQQQEVSR
jgi:TrmH family RNA methyltransferase